MATVKSSGLIGSIDSDVRSQSIITNDSVHLAQFR